MSLSIEQQPIHQPTNMSTTIQCLSNTEIFGIIIHELNSNDINHFCKSCKTTYKMIKNKHVHYVIISIYAKVLEININMDENIINVYFPKYPEEILDQLKTYRKFLWKIPKPLIISTRKLCSGRITIINVDCYSFPMDLYGRIHGIDVMQKYINTPLYVRDVRLGSVYKCISHVKKHKPDFSFFGKIINSSPQLVIGDKVIINDVEDFTALIGKYILPQSIDIKSVHDVGVFTCIKGNDGNYVIYYSTVNRDEKLKEELIENVKSSYNSLYT